MATISGAARETRIFQNVPAPMRDDIRLMTTVFLPIPEGRYPMVLVRLVLPLIPTPRT
jgi:predicted acyl esterase